MLNVVPGLPPVGPPQPDTYTLPHLSTKKATGEMLVVAVEPLPYTVENKRVFKLLFRADINCGLFGLE